MSKILEEFRRRVEGGETLALITEEEAIETATGRSRGQCSVSVLSPASAGGLIEINDEISGFRGTARPEDFWATLEGYERQGVVLKGITAARDRRADWQNLNDDTRRGTMRREI